MDVLSSLHDAICKSLGTDADWSKEKTKTLYKSLNREQQKLIRDLVKEAAASGQIFKRLEAEVSKVVRSKDAEIQKLRRQLAELSGQEQKLPTPPELPERAVTVASRRELLVTSQMERLDEETREVVMIREFVSSVRQDSTLLHSLQDELKTGQRLDSGDKSVVRKTVVANIENWIINQKRPVDISFDDWKKLVRESIADPSNNALLRYNLPNLHHFIESQIMRVRQLLSPKR